MATDFLQFMRDRVGANWVIARRTPRIVHQYGDSVVCLSPKRYRALVEEHKALGTRATTDALDAIHSALETARKLIEQLPSGYTPGHRSGPQERETHAQLVVALRLGQKVGLPGFQTAEPQAAGELAAAAEVAASNIVESFALRTA